MNRHDRNIVFAIIYGKGCDDKDCFISNNWFGASPNHPGNKKAYAKCLTCKTAKGTK